MAGVLSAMARSLVQLFIARLSVEILAQCGKVYPGGLIDHYTLAGSETQT